MENIQNSKLIAKLKLLSNSEYLELGKWLNSPWSNSNKKLYELHGHLQKLHPHFEEKYLSKERLFKKLYPEKKYNNRWLRNLMGALSKQVDSFLVHMHLKTSQGIQNLILREQYLNRGSPLIFNKISDEMIATLEQKKTKSWLDFFQLMFLWEGKYFQPYSISRVTSGESILHKAEDYLDKFYVIGKYRILNEYSERSKILKESKNIEKKVNSIGQMFRAINLPIVELYQLRLEPSQKSPLEKYLASKEWFKKYQDSLPIKEQKVFLLSLINDASGLKIKGHKEGLKEMFDLYQLGLETKLLFHKGKITDRSYTNIITIANLLSNSNYSENFIKTYTPHLPMETQEDAHIWGKAHTTYYKRELDSARELLFNHNFSNITFTIQGKLLLFQIYFDLNREDHTFYQPFTSYSISVERFFRNNKYLSRDRKKAYLNLFKYAKTINKLLQKNKLDIVLKRKWEKIIQEDKNLHGRRWLISKLEDNTVL